MGFIDLIRELRTGAPNLKKAAKTMKFIGWGCLFGGLWNFIFPLFAPFKESGFSLPMYYPSLALIVLTVIGTLFLLSAHGIKEMEPWGKKMGQAAIILLFAAIFGFIALMPIFDYLPSNEGSFKIMIYIFFAFGMAQFGLPLYFGFWYLGRLPIKDDPYSTIHYNPNEISRTLSERMNDRTKYPHYETKYKDSPFPFGIVGTFALLIAVPLVGVLINQKYTGPGYIPYLFPLVFFFIFLGPTVFNYLSSPFQKNRRLVATFTGGGSIFLFHGSWPFFRLMVYDDALEVRVMFHRFLIPYEKMDDIPNKIAFFSSGILIKSDLPDVPSNIRFSGFGMKKILLVVSKTRNSYVTALQIPKGENNGQSL